MQGTDNALKRCGDISVQMLDDLSSFGARTITDPETGMPIDVQGYPVEANQPLLSYISTVADAFEWYYDCLCDLFFYEILFSPETYPEFPKTEHVAQYLKISYQSWLIKVNTSFDCTLQTLNAVFELAIPLRDVNRKTILEKKINLSSSALLNHVDNMDQLLKAVIQHTATRKSPKSIKAMRNKIVHSNEFDHTILSDLHFDVSLFSVSILDTDAFDLQASISSKGIELQHEVQATNLEVLKEVYPIFEYLGAEYQKRFKEKLIQ